MDIMYSVLMYVLFGFFGLLLLAFVLAALFGKRLHKRLEFEAVFRTPGGTEFGEFEIELSRVEKAEPEYTFKASFTMHHESLGKGLTVQVFLDELLVMQGKVSRDGRIALREKAILNAVEVPGEGQVCRVVWSGIEQFRAPLRPD